MERDASRCTHKWPAGKSVSCSLEFIQGLALLITICSGSIGTVRQKSDAKIRITGLAQQADYLHGFLSPQLLCRDGRSVLEPKAYSATNWSIVAVTEAAQSHGLFDLQADASHIRLAPTKEMLQKVAKDYKREVRENDRMLIDSYKAGYTVVSFPQSGSAFGTSVFCKGEFFNSSVQSVMPASVSFQGDPIPNGDVS